MAGRYSGTELERGRPLREYFVGLAELYVSDARFARNYVGTEGAQFVRDAMRAYAEDRLRRRTTVKRS